MTAEERAAELAHTPADQVPQLANDFYQHRARTIGVCMEVCIWAFTIYAHLVEGLECTQYEPSDEDRKWFAARTTNDLEGLRDQLDAEDPQ